MNHYLRHAWVLGLQPHDAVVAYRRRGAPRGTAGDRGAARGSYEHLFLHRYLPRGVQGCLQQVCCSANVLAMQLASATAQKQSRSVAGRQSALLPAADVANMQRFCFFASGG